VPLGIRDVLWSLALGFLLLRFSGEASGGADGASTLPFFFWVYNPSIFPFPFTGRPSFTSFTFVIFSPFEHLRVFLRFLEVRLPICLFFSPFDFPLLLQLKTFFPPGLFEEREKESPPFFLPLLSAADPHQTSFIICILHMRARLVKTLSLFVIVLFLF